jgi:opacity protein-like surface antigen
MKRLLLLCAVALSITSLGIAQDTPQYELFAGASYLRVHAGGTELTQLLGVPSIQYQPHNMNLNLYGWEGTLIENVNHWLGGEIDAGGFYGSPGASFLYPASELVSPSPNFGKVVPIVTRNQTVLFGPRFSLRTQGRLVFFAHLPVGVAHVNTSLSESAIVASDFGNLPVGSLKASTGLAISPGVGIDVRMNARLMIRPIQLDYLMTHVFGARQDNVRVSAGLNFTFGEK